MAAQKPAFSQQFIKNIKQTIKKNNLIPGLSAQAQHGLSQEEKKFRSASQPPELPKNELNSDREIPVGDQPAEPGDQ